MLKEYSEHSHLNELLSLLEKVCCTILQADSIPSRILDLAIEAALCTLAPPKEDVRAPLYAPDLNLLTYLVEAGFLKELPEIAPASLTDWDRWEWDRAVLKIHLRRFCQNNGRTLDVNHILRSLFGTESGVLVLKLELPHMPERDILYLQYQHLASLQKVKIKSLLGMPDWVCYLEWWKKAVEEYVLYQKREVQVITRSAILFFPDLAAVVSVKIVTLLCGQATLNSLVMLRWFRDCSKTLRTPPVCSLTTLCLYGASGDRGGGAKSHRNSEADSPEAIQATARRIHVDRDKQNGSAFLSHVGPVLRHCSKAEDYSTT